MSDCLENDSPPQREEGQGVVGWTVSERQPPLTPPYQGGEPDDEALSSVEPWVAHVEDEAVGLPPSRADDRIPPSDRQWKSL
jgi:hypothetical protein